MTDQLTKILRLALLDDGPNGAIALSKLKTMVDPHTICLIDQRSSGSWHNERLGYRMQEEMLKVARAERINNQLSKIIDLSKVRMTMTVDDLDSEIGRVIDVLQKSMQHITPPRLATLKDVIWYLEPISRSSIVKAVTQMIARGWIEDGYNGMRMTPAYHDAQAEKARDAMKRYA